MKYNRKKVGYVTASLAGLALIGWVNPAGNFPLNDDWQYAFPVQQLLEEGRLAFQGYFAPNILLQVGWGYLFCLPFGEFDYTYLRCSTLFLAGAGIWALYQLGGAMGLSPGARRLSVLAMGGSPLYVALAFTFMTDVPFLAICLLAFLAFWRYLEEGRALYLYLAVLAAVAAFLIRQPGLLLLPAMGLALLWNRRNQQAIYTAVGLTAVALLSYLSVEKALKPALGIDPHYVPVSLRYWEVLVDHPRHFFTNQIKKGMQSLIFLGFFSLPFYPFFHEKIRRLGYYRSDTLLPVLAVNSVVFLFFWLRSEIFFPFAGNILDRGGIGPELLMDNITLALPNTPEFPAPLFPALQWLAQLSISFLLLLSVDSGRTLRGNDRLFFLFLLLLNLAYLPLMSIFSYFDRYLLLPMASLFIWLGYLLGRSPQLPFTPLKYLPLILMAFFSILGTKDYLSWNRAKHQAFLFLREQEVSIKAMDAGYEYNGFYNFQPKWQAPDGLSGWWVESDQFLITFGAVPGYQPITRFKYYRYLFMRTDWIYVLKKEKNE